MTKKKASVWSYIIFGILAVAGFIFLYANGVNLIDEYKTEIAGVVFLWFAKFASKKFGWDLSFLMKDETKEKAGSAIVKAQLKGIAKSKRAAGRLRAKIARAIYRKKTGAGRMKAAFVIANTYRTTKKNNPEIWER